MADKTDAEIVTKLRLAIYNLLLTNTKSYSMDGVSYTKNDLPQLKETLVFFESRANETTNPRVSVANLSGNEQ